MIAVLDASSGWCGFIAASGHTSDTPPGISTLVLAPDLFVSEVCNALWKYRKAALLTREEADLALSRSLDLPDRIEPAFACYREAFEIAAKYQHPFNDALYLVIARRNNALLLTLDRRLATLAAKIEVAVLQA